VFGFLIRALTFIVSAALGLILAEVLLEGFHIHWSNWWGFALAVLIFALIQSVLAPLASRLTRRHAPALLGGVGIISTFISIVVVVLIPGAGIGISQPLAWIVAPLLVWIVTALATWLVPPMFIKERAQDRRD
jgi:hypothetical protein